VCLDPIHVSNSRNVSAEIFVVCRGFKAPQKLDPKFLDPRSVFEELPDAAPNAEARVFHPEKRKRQREGYEDGDYTFYKEESAIEFVQTQDPIQMLSSTSRITWSDEESRKLKLKELTTKEIIACCDDLKVLGKKDFRNLLKWRLAIRSDLGLAAKTEEPEEPTETVTITEDDQIDADMARMLAQDAASKKRERRRLNERKQKEITRMQLGMLTPHELGMEHDAMDGDEMFGLKPTQKNGVLTDVLSGAVPEADEDDDSEMEFHEDDENADDVDNLEAQLDNMYFLPLSLAKFRYDKYRERKAEINAKYRAKRAREEVDEWDGIGENGDNAETRSSSDSDSDTDSEMEIDEEDVKSISTTKRKGNAGSSLEPTTNGKLSKRAEQFFDQPDFDGIDLDSEDDTQKKDDSSIQKIALENGDKDSETEDDFEIVPSKPAVPESWSEDDSDDEKSLPQRQGKSSCFSILIL